MNRRALLLSLGLVSAALLMPATFAAPAKEATVTLEVTGMT
jgi:hypothetical protein